MICPKCRHEYPDEHNAGIVVRGSCRVCAIEERLKDKGAIIKSDYKWRIIARRDESCEMSKL